MATKPCGLSVLCRAPSKHQPVEGLERTKQTQRILAFLDFLAGTTHYVQASRPRCFGSKPGHHFQSHQCRHLQISTEMSSRPAGACENVQGGWAKRVRGNIETAGLSGVSKPEILSTDAENLAPRRDWTHVHVGVLQVSAGRKHCGFCRQTGWHWPLAMEIWKTVVGRIWTVCTTGSPINSPLRSSVNTHCRSVIVDQQTTQLQLDLRHGQLYQFQGG